MQLRPQFPPGTLAITPPRSSYAAGTAVQRWRVQADGGLAGKVIEFPNLVASRIDVLVRVERSDGTAQVGRVLALLILVQGTRRLIATITAFTLAHSLTLFAATLGWLTVPGPPVEAVIALSIVFVAGEIVHARQGRPGLTQRPPPEDRCAFVGGGACRPTPSVVSPASG